MVSLAVVEVLMECTGRYWWQNGSGWKGGSRVNGRYGDRVVDMDQVDGGRWEINGGRWERYLVVDCGGRWKI